MSRLVKFIEIERWLPGARESGGKWRVIVDGCRISVWGDENIVELDNDNGCITL